MVVTEVPAWVERVDAILRVKDRNRAWLAKRLGIHQSQLSHLMRGDRRYRAVTEQPDLMQRFCDVLETPMSMVFSDLSPAKECPNEPTREAHE